MLIKPETLQRVGAFKFRGAYNRLVQLPLGARSRGVVAFSSGNHAQGVALAAQLLEMPALIVMPADAPVVKVEATRGYGAEIRFYDRLTEDREAIAAEIARTRGAITVPAFDDLRWFERDPAQHRRPAGLEPSRLNRGVGIANGIDPFRRTAIAVRQRG